MPYGTGGAVTQPEQRPPARASPREQHCRLRRPLISSQPAPVVIRSSTPVAVDIRADARSVRRLADGYARNVTAKHAAWSLTTIAREVDPTSHGHMREPSCPSCESGRILRTPRQHEMQCGSRPCKFTVRREPRIAAESCCAEKKEAAEKCSG